MRYHPPRAGSSTAEQLTLNQLVESSNLSRLTTPPSCVFDRGVADGDPFGDVERQDGVRAARMGSDLG